MSTIKIDSDAVHEVVSQLRDKVSVYRDGVVSSVARLNDFQESLEGEAYTSLVSDVRSTLASHELLVAECVALSSQLALFIESIVAAETSVTFE